MDQKIIDLYDKFTHGLIDRRTFLDRAALITGSAAAATALLPLLKNDYAKAQTVAENDPSIKASTLTIEQGTTSIPETGKLTGYLVQPTTGDKFPALIVFHENRGLNPHIKDITRRLAKAGYLALGVDFLSPLGGTPDDEDKARDMIATLKQPTVLEQARAALKALKKHPASTGKVGAIGFCWGGGWVNALAVADPTLDAGVAYYGMQPPSDKVGAIKAPLLLNYAGLDERINAGIPAFEAALKADGKAYELYVYEGVNHAFNNESTPSRYNKQAADLAWQRTLTFLKKYLG